MKRKNEIKRVILGTCMASVMMISFPKNTFAESMLKAEGNTTAKVNDIISVDIRLEDIEKPIVGIGGDIVVDKDYLELVNFESKNDLYEIRMNKNILRFSGFSPLNQGVSDDTTIFTLEFKALKVGETTISFKNEELSDNTPAIAKSKTNSLTLNILEEKEVIEDKEDYDNTLETKTEDKKEQRLEAVDIKAIDKKADIERARINKESRIATRFIESFKPENIRNLFWKVNKNNTEFNFVNKLFSLLKRK